jgi:hypothetical protein
MTPSAGTTATGTAEKSNGKAPEILSADAILRSEDLARETVEVPEWGGAVVVSALSVHALNEANRKATVNGEVDAEKITVQLVIEGMVEPKLSDDQAGQLAGKSAAVMNRLGSIIFRLSGVDTETVRGLEGRFREGAE